MSMQQHVNVYDSQSSKYHEAFQIFLDHTDQKVKAQQWLSQLINMLPQRRVLIDVGAGNGKVTSWLIDSFDRTIAIEPNESLREELKRNCPQIEVIPEKILDAKITALGDLILCSHVFYYIDDTEWMINLERLASWLSPEGALVVVLQNHETNCMQMLEHFFGRRFDLIGLAQAFQHERGEEYEVEVETGRAQAITSDFDSSYTIAEFMLNLLPMSAPPARSDFEEYVRSHFAFQGGFRFCCDQDFLQIRPRIGSTVKKS